MKIPSVPSRREPPRVSSLDDLRRFKVARFTCKMSRGLYFQELTFSDGFVLSHSEYNGHSRDWRFSYHQAAAFLRDHFFFAVRGASEEF